MAIACCRPLGPLQPPRRPFYSARARCNAPVSEKRARNRRRLSFSHHLYRFCKDARGDAELPTALLRGGRVSTAARCVALATDVGEMLLGRQTGRSCGHGMGALDLADPTTLRALLYVRLRLRHRLLRSVHQHRPHRRRHRRQSALHDPPTLATNICDVDVCLGTGACDYGVLAAAQAARVSEHGVRADGAFEGQTGGLVGRIRGRVLQPSDAKSDQGRQEARLVPQARQSARAIRRAQAVSAADRLCAVVRYGAGCGAALALVRSPAAHGAL
ncbi:hypothetical protein L1887_63104 [Cichorium endivia]|nr:hypothetical protein L1887_63104 [Cichorium endivia]